MRKGDDICAGPDASVEICELRTKPPEPVVDAAPTEQETVEQLLSLSHDAKALSRYGMLYALYCSYATKGLC